MVLYYLTSQYLGLVWPLNLTRSPFQNIISPRSKLQLITHLKNLPLNFFSLRFPPLAVHRLQSPVLASHFIVLNLGFLNQPADYGLLEAVVDHGLQIVEEIERGNRGLFE